MVTVGKDWTLWRPDNETSIHIDWSGQLLRIDVVREGENASKLMLPFPATVEKHYVSATRYSVLVALDAHDGNSLKIRLYYDGEEATLQLEGMGFLVNVKLREG